MLSVVALLGNGRIEEDDRAAHKEDDFFVYELASLLEFTAIIASAFSGLATNRILKSSSHITRADAIDPFQFNFNVVRSGHVVVKSLVLESVGDNRLQSCVEPRPKVERSPILS